MSNRVITITLFGVILFIFTFYFIVQKTIFPSGQPIKGLFQNIIQDAQLNQWPAAVRKTHLLEKEWEERKYLIMFNYAEADYQVFEDTVYALTVAAETKEKFETISRAKMGQKLWENFLKILPEP